MMSRLMIEQAMFGWKAGSKTKGGHKPCLCEGVAGLRPATLSHKHGQCCFGSAGVWLRAEKKKEKKKRKKKKSSTSTSGGGVGG